MIDLHLECSKLKSIKQSDRISELANNLPPVAIIAIGGFPIYLHQAYNELYWFNIPATNGNIRDVILKGLGLSGILTYTNKSNKSLLELGNICYEKNHCWAFHWINISFIFAKHHPNVELAFARDTVFYLSWPIQQQPTGEVFVATAGIKEWKDYIKHKDDMSFDEHTRNAMTRVYNILSEII